MSPEMLFYIIVCTFFVGVFHTSITTIITALFFIYFAGKGGSTKITSKHSKNQF